MDGQAFHEVEHTADRAFRAQGRDLRELFQNAAQSMFALEGPASGLPATTSREIEVEGFDRETLLVNWLNELLYQQEAHGEKFESFEISEITGQRLRARAALVEAAAFGHERWVARARRSDVSAAGFSGPLWAARFEARAWLHIQQTGRGPLTWLAEALLNPFFLLLKPLILLVVWW